MFKHYVFWGLFALVLIGIGFSLWDRHRRSQKARELEAASRAAASSRAKPAVGPANEAANEAATSSLEPEFDPRATRIHYRGPADGMPAPLSARNAAPLPPEKTAKLVCVGGSLKHQSFPVTAAGLRVGRDPKNDVVIADPRTSYRHAWIGIIDHKGVLRDLGSTNGTFFNTQIDSPVGEVELSPGDMIFFGGHGRDQFLFVVD